MRTLQFNAPTHPTRKTDARHTERTVAGVRLVRSGIGWKPEGSDDIEFNFDEGQRLWVVDYPGDWFYTRSIRRGVEALITLGHITKPAPDGDAA